MSLKNINENIEKEIERLSNLDVESELFNREVSRGQAIANLSKSHIRNIYTAYQIEKFLYETQIKETSLKEISKFGE